MSGFDVVKKRPSPTFEQLEAVRLFSTGENLKITAFAGAGKTSTLELLADANSQRGLYLAFNKKIASEAGERFPANVDCRTTHSLAWRGIKNRYGSSSKLTQSLYPKQLAVERGYQKRSAGGRLSLDATQQAFLVLKAVNSYCQSADDKLKVEHVPTLGALRGHKDELVQLVKEWALGEAQKLWDDMVNPSAGVPLGHDGYLKLWALDRPVIGASYILLDEAQDSNPVVLEVLQRQDAQLVYVGDRHQQIYEWRGAINAMQTIKTTHHAYLTQSFRFGPQVAAEAAKVLQTLGETELLRGNENISSRVSASGLARAVLARTNATVIAETVGSLDAGRQPFIVGGTQELKRLVADVYELKKRQPAKSPEFFGFTSWAEVVAFSQTEEGENLLSFVQLVEKHGEAKLYRAVTSVCDDEDQADVILSTAHKAKGCEWTSVRLASDFLSSRPAESRKQAEAEVRLFYVAMTRAKEELIVDPEVLTMFSSGTWKQRGERSKAAAGSNALGSAAKINRATATSSSLRQNRDEIGRRTASEPRREPLPARVAPKEVPTLTQRLARWLGL